MEPPRFWEKGSPRRAEKNWKFRGKRSHQDIMSISAATKLELILASLRAEVSIADLCRRAQVPESTFRDWRDRFIAAGTAALQPGKTSQGDPEKTALIHENARLKTVVADLSVENLVLKKGRNGAWSPAAI